MGEAYINPLTSRKRSTRRRISPVAGDPDPGAKCQVNDCTHNASARFDEQGSRKVRALAGSTLPMQLREHRE